MIIDTHIHADARSSEDFKDMYLSGLDLAISCAYYPYKLRSPECLLNHFDRILEFDTQRAKYYGLNLEVALGIHPVNSIKDYGIVLDELESLIDEGRVNIIGEVGLERNNQLEREVLKKQLELADSKKVKVIVHTPRRDKSLILGDILDIISTSINPELVVIDHVNSSIIDSVNDFGGFLGLTVQPQKLTSGEVVDILDSYGFDKFLLNSDISNKPSNPLSVVETVRTLERLEFSKADIEKVAFKNALSFFNL